MASIFTNIKNYLFPKIDQEFQALLEDAKVFAEDPNNKGLAIQVFSKSSGYESLYPKEYLRPFLEKYPEYLENPDKRLGNSGQTAIFFLYNNEEYLKEFEQICSEKGKTIDYAVRDINGASILNHAVAGNRIGAVNYLLEKDELLKLHDITNQNIQPESENGSLSPLLPKPMNLLEEAITNHNGPHRDLTTISKILVEKGVPIPDNIKALTKENEHKKTLIEVINKHKEDVINYREKMKGLEDNISGFTGVNQNPIAIFKDSKINDIDNTDLEIFLRDKEYTTNLNKADEAGNYPLHYLVDEPDFIKTYENLCKENKVSINYSVVNEKTNSTVLAEAAATGRQGTVEYLIDKVDKSKETMVLKQCLESHFSNGNRNLTEICKLLVKKGFSLPDDYSSPADPDKTALFTKFKDWKSKPEDSSKTRSNSEVSTDSETNSEVSVITSPIEDKPSLTNSNEPTQEKKEQNANQQVPDSKQPTQDQTNKNNDAEEAKKPSPLFLSWLWDIFVNIPFIKIFLPSEKDREKLEKEIEKELAQQQKQDIAEIDDPAKTKDAPKKTIAQQMMERIFGRAKGKYDVDNPSALKTPLNSPGMASNNNQLGGPGEGRQ